MKRDMKKDNLQKVVVTGVFILLVLLIFNLFSIFNLKPQLEGRIIEIKELAKPANLELTVIKDTSCIYCFDINNIVEKIKSTDVNVTKEIILDAAFLENKEAINELVDKYNIKKFPTIILNGEINKTSFQNFEQIGDVLIFNKIDPPYIDAKTREMMGKVKAVIITDKSCDICNDFDVAIQGLQQNGIVFSDIKYLDYKDDEAKELINKFNIEKVSTLFLSDDIEVYSTWKQLKSAFAFKGEYYFIESSAPYTEIDTGKIRGLVTLIMLTDDSCFECYDVSVNKQILQRFGIVIDEEKTLDISSSEGKQLIEKYEIKKAPTILLSPETEVYDSLVQTWSQVGNREEDGWFVMRSPEVLGVVKDLTSGELIDLRQAK
jgi:predicted DCC family thiol-disulfide oxidoreductase YuxK